MDKGNDKQKETDAFLHDPNSHIQNLYKISKILTIAVSWRPLTEISLKTKKEWPNKGNDKQEESDTLLHDTTSHTKFLYQITKP